MTLNKTKRFQGLVNKANTKARHIVETVDEEAKKKKKHAWLKNNCRKYLFLKKTVCLTDTTTTL